MNRNYQKELDIFLENLIREGNQPSLLLHACCAPCSSYVLEYLAQYFHITLFFYNPNIYPETEYRRRCQELEKFLSALPVPRPIHFIEGEFDPPRFYDTVKGWEEEREGGERCFRCYELRLEEAAAQAKQLGCDYFTTTLSISPHKNALKLNEIGERLSQQYGVAYLYSDFKKKNGFKRSLELSKVYGLYRQDYCGCVFSQRCLAIYAMRPHD